MLDMVGEILAGRWCRMLTLYEAAEFGPIRARNKLKDLSLVYTAANVSNGHSYVV